MAVNCWVSPTGTFAVSGDTATDSSTVGITVITDVPESKAPESVAVTVARPVAFAVTKPPEDTVAVAVLEDDHVTELVKFSVPPPSRLPVAVICWVSPTGTFAVRGDTVTDNSTAAPAGAALETSTPVVIAIPSTKAPALCSQARGWLRDPTIVLICSPSSEGGRHADTRPC